MFRKFPDMMPVRKEQCLIPLCIGETYYFRLPNTKLPEKLCNSVKGSCVRKPARIPCDFRNC